MPESILHSSGDGPVIDTESVDLATANLQAVRRAAAGGDWKAAAWWLSHHPSTRDQFGDVEAVNRAVRAHTSRFLDVLMVFPELTREARYRLMLALAAAGAAPLPEEHESRDGREGRRLLREWLAEQDQDVDA
jgi:hypothetical protein